MVFYFGVLWVFEVCSLICWIWFGLIVLLFVLVEVVVLPFVLGFCVLL